MIYWLITFIITTIVFIYTTINLLIKLERFEKHNDDQEFKTRNLLRTLRTLDSKQMFEKDDDVGTLFAQIKDKIEAYAKF